MADSLPHQPTARSIFPRPEPDPAPNPDPPPQPPPEPDPVEMLESPGENQNSF